MTFQKPFAFSTIVETPVPLIRLVSILSLRRSARSEGDEALIDSYLMPLNPDMDNYGNLFVTILDGKEEPAAAFTSHTDSVHFDAPGEDQLAQTLTVSNGNRMLHLADPDNDDCLGADDGTGIWLMLNMIEAGVPGLYCFFRDEEIGRLGSEWSIRHEPERYAAIDMMLSFDRKGTQDIITHQMGARCCSELFAEQLSAAIHPECAPDDTGSFTDSYSFMGMIPECTNVCVGYYHQHTGDECQDLTWAAFLANRLIEIDWAGLPVARDPEDDEMEIDEHSPTMTELLCFFPEESSDALEAYMGITAGELLIAIADNERVTPTQLQREIDWGFSERPQI